MNKLPTVSIVIPAWNASETLAHCIKSFQHQLYQPFEIIIVNDGSTDNTADVVRSISSDNLPIRLISFDINRGPAYSRNIGIKEAKGDIICFAESDGKYCLTYLKKCVKVFLDEKRKIYSGGGLRICWRINNAWADFWNVIFEARWYLLKSGKIRPRGGWIFHRISLEEIGFYDESLREGEDVDLSLRLERNGYNSIWIPNIFFIHMEPQTFNAIWYRFFKSGKGTIPYRAKCGSLLKDSLLSCVLIGISILFPINLFIIPLMIIANQESRIGWIRLLKKSKRKQIKILQGVFFPYRYFFFKLSSAVGIIFGILKG
jgi:glycosyltransferase involved in cell wall biosynthesis